MTETKKSNETIMNSLKKETSGIGITRILSIFVFIVFSAILIFVIKYAPILLPIFIFLEAFPVNFFISTYKSWEYDEKKFVKKRLFIKKIVYYTDIIYFKNEPCFSPGRLGSKPHIYKQGFFTLKNEKKIEFDFPCSSKEFMKMWRKIKKANPNVKLFELPQ